MRLPTPSIFVLLGSFHSPLLILRRMPSRIAGGTDISSDMSNMSSKFVLHDWRDDRSFQHLIKSSGEYSLHHAGCQVLSLGVASGDNAKHSWRSMGVCSGAAARGASGGDDELGMVIPISAKFAISEIT